MSVNDPPSPSADSPDPGLPAASGRDRRRRWGLLTLVGAFVTVGELLAGLGELIPEEQWPWGLLALAAGTVLTAVFELVLFLRENGGELRSGPRSPRRAPGRVLREELPPPSEHFTGHTETLDEIVRLFRRFPRGRARWRTRVRSRFTRTAASPLVVVVTGEGGTGKTELVNQVISRIEDRFPDGKLEFQLYGEPAEPRDQRYRGLAPARHTPRRPERVLAQLLAQIGAPPHPDLPLDELRGQWRTLTRNHRLLLVLDNAKDFAQVEPLLPKGAGCAVLITSRNSFADSTGYTVRRYPLDRLPVAQGVRLLRRLMGDAAAATPDGEETLAAIVRECYQLPLAICWCGSRLSARDSPTPDHLLRYMRQDKERALLGPAGITSSFRFGFQECSAAERLLLARVARTGLPTFTAWAAAALLGAATRDVRSWLTDLADRYLVVRLPDSRTGHVRFQLHDHVRTILLNHDAEQLGVPRHERAEWSDRRFAAAVDRMLRAYVWLAEAAARRRAPQENGFPQPAVAPLDPAEELELRTPGNPEAWLEAERRCLLACAQLARQRGDRLMEWRLARALSALCRNGRVYWEDWRTSAETALELSQKLGDDLAHAISLLDLAEIAGSQGGHDEALRRAREAEQRLGRRKAHALWRARASRLIGVNLFRSGNLDDGRTALAEAEQIFAAADEHWWYARTLCNQADLYRFQGDLHRARDLLRDARTLLADGAPADRQLLKARLQTGEVLGRMGRELGAWVALDAVLTAAEQGEGAVWYRARCLRELGQLDARRLRHQFEQCDLLLAPERDAERRRVLGDYVWQRCLGSAEKMRECGDDIAAEWHRARLAQVRGWLDEEQWEDYVSLPTSAAPLPRWTERVHRMRAASERWTLRHQVELLEEAHELFREIGDSWGRLRTLRALGEQRMREDPEQGRREFEEAAAGFRALGDGWWEARTLRRAADTLYEKRRFAEAREFAERARDGYATLNHLSGQLRTQLLLGRILGGLGEQLAAERVLREAERMAETGLRQDRVPRELWETTRRVVSAALGEDLREISDDRSRSS